MNDKMIGMRESTDSVSNERRESDRNEVQVEVVVSWHFQPDQSMRYETLDLSDTGMRIRSSTPLLEGMTGVIGAILPEGRKVNRACMVVWSRHAASGSGHEAGLRFF